MVRVEDAEKKTKFIPWSYPDVFDLSNMKVRPKNEDGTIMSAEDMDKKNPTIILLLDDIHLCGPDVQKFLFQLLTQHAINKHALPSNIALLLAGNRAEDRAGFRQMNAGISSRVNHKNIKGDPQVWVEDYAIPHKLQSDIISFIQYYPAKLNGTPLENRAWNNSRTWSESSRQIDAMERYIGRPLDNDEKYVIIEFYNFCSLLLEWRAHEIIDGKRKIVEDRSKVKSNDDIVIDQLDKISAYALLTACIGEIQKRLRKVDFKVNSESTKLMDFVREDIIEPLAKRHREIVPLGLKILIIEETKEKKQAVLVSKLLKDKKLVKMLLDIM